MAELETGAIVASHYVIVSLLGQGGMGAVYRAKDERSGDLVAIKVLREARGDLATRFLREARIASALAHRNIARVIEVLELDDGTPAIVMELLHGESLGARLARTGKLEPTAVAKIFIAVVAAMKAAHARGVVHRDLKPDNIFLCDDGAVKVLDFGIARVTDAAADPAITVEALTDTGQILGTPQYMAPEQIFGEKDIDARADVWALGVILYQALAGVRPFDGANPGQVFKAIALDPPTPLAERAPKTPPALLELVDRMLVHARAERLTDLDEVTRALERVLATDIGEAPTLLADKAPKPSSRRPVVLLALVCTALGAAGVLGNRSHSSPPDANRESAPPISAPLTAHPNAPPSSFVDDREPATPSSVVTTTVASIAPPTKIPPAASAVRHAPSATPSAAPPSADAGSTKPNRSGPLKRDEF